jgi:hypothetical protein
MVKYGLFFLACLAITPSVIAQKKNKKQAECPTYTEDLRSGLVYKERPDYEKEEDKGSKTFLAIKDDSASIDSVDQVLKQYYGNKTKAKGWRIQIWDGSNHLQMNEEISKYKASLSNLGLIVHDEYDKTMFRLRVGDFTYRLDAFRALQAVKKYFPNALLVPDEVDLSKI